MTSIQETATRLVLKGPYDELTQLAQSMKIRPPDYWRSDAYQLYKATNGDKGWDGYLYPLKVSRDGEKPGSYCGEVLRGHLWSVQDYAKIHSIQLDSNQLLPRPFKGIVADDIPDDIIQADFKLDLGQRECVAQWLSAAIGINHVSVSGGKTAMFAAVAAMIKTRHPDARFIYITPSERLVRQSFKEMRKFLPAWHITQFGGGKNDPLGKDMVICTSAMLNTHYTSLLQNRWLASFQAVLFDESHHAASKSNQKILRAVKAFYRLGASDTAKEEDIVKFATITGLLGPILERRITTGELIDAARVAKPLIYIVDEKSWSRKYETVSHIVESDTNAWVLTEEMQWKQALYQGPAYEHDPDTLDGIKRDKKGLPVQVLNRHRMLIDGIDHEVESRWCLLDRTYDRAIIRFQERNQRIVEWVEYWAKGLNYQTLVVATRTTHALILYSLIGEKIGLDMVKLLFSQHDSKQRDEAFKWFKDTPGSVLVTPLVKEGVSINEIRAGVIADHIVSSDVARQIIGRFIRKKEGDNEAHIVWFIDRQHPKLRRNSIMLFKELETQRGFSFYYPCNSPHDIELAPLYATSSPNIPSRL